MQLDREKLIFILIQPFDLDGYGIPEHIATEAVDNFFKTLKDRPAFESNDDAAEYIYNAIIPWDD